MGELEVWPGEYDWYYGVVYTDPDECGSMIVKTRRTRRVVKITK